MKYFIRTILGLISFIVVALFVIAILFVYQLNQGKTPYIMGYTAFINTGTSMLPEIQVGDLVIVFKSDNYSKGDVISYVAEDNLTVTHRIVDVTPDGYRTKGDNNKFIDGALVVDENTYGEVMYVLGGFGVYANFIYDNKVAIIVVMFALVLLGFGVKIWRSHVRKRSDRASS